MGSPVKTGAVLDIAVLSDGHFLKQPSERSRSGSDQSPDETRKKISNISPERQRKLQVEKSKVRDPINSTKIVQYKVSDPNSSESEHSSGSHKESASNYDEPFNKEMVKPNQNALEVPATALDLEKMRVYESFVSAFNETYRLAKREFKDRIPLNQKEKEEFDLAIQSLEEQCAKMRADLDVDHIEKIEFFKKLVLDLGQTRQSKNRMLDTVFSFLDIPQEHKKAVRKAFLEEPTGKEDAFLKSQLRFHIIYNYSQVFEVIFERLLGNNSYVAQFNARSLSPKNRSPFSRLDGVQQAITPAVFIEKSIHKFCENIVRKRLDIESAIQEIKIHYIEKILNPLKIKMARQALLDFESYQKDARIMYSSVTKFWAERFANTNDPDVFEDAKRAIYSESLSASKPNGVALVPPYVNDWESHKVAAEEVLEKWICSLSGVCTESQFNDSDLYQIVNGELKAQFGDIDGVSEDLYSRALQRRKEINKFKSSLKKDSKASNEFYSRLDCEKGAHRLKLFKKWKKDRVGIISEDLFNNDAEFCRAMKSLLNSKYPKAEGLSEKQENTILERRSNVKRHQVSMKKNRALQELFITRIIDKLERLHHKPKLEAYVLQWQRVFGEELLGDGPMMVELCRLQQELAEGLNFKRDPDETLFDGQRRIMGLIIQKAQDPKEFINFLTQLTMNLVKWKIRDFVTRKLIKNETIVFQDQILMEEFNRRTFIPLNEEVNDAKVEQISIDIFNWVKDVNKIDRIIPYPVMKILQALTYMYGVSRQKNTEGLTTVFIDAWRAVLFPLDKKEIEELDWETKEKKKIEIVFDKDIYTTFMKRFKISSDKNPEHFYLFTQVMTYTRPHLGSLVEPFVTAEVSYQTPLELQEEIQKEIEKKTEKLSLILAAQCFPPLKWSNPEKQ